MRSALYVCFFLCGIFSAAFSQSRGTLLLGGDIYEYMVDECGDTIILATLGDISVSSIRHFKNPEDYNKYRRYRRYAYTVYPYATEAIRIFRELEHATATMRDGERRRHIRRLQKELKEKFEDPLRNLTRTQGMILVEMIERELKTPLFDLIKDLRGGLNASYWSTMSSFYGYKIKEGYIRGNDPILDTVLDDVNLTYNNPYENK
ncbi:MAG: DUF4294 domain-containing protein [Haliscomenobacter sp.]|nr:DUF4294 domain-containing protein [Haliscomenobacter sp.]